MKYVIFKDKISGLIQPVLFGEHTTHSMVKVDRADSISAGFFSFEKGIPTVYGESESLRLKSEKKDLDYIIKTFMNVGTMFFLS